MDGNTYKVVLIGNQVWMAENLRTTKYSDGTKIPYAPGNDAWQTASVNSTPAFCWHNNDSTLKTPHGALYNWFAGDTASNSNRNICPAGWHLPSFNEYSVLVNYAGGENAAGGKLKETGTVHWNSPNAEATNEYGFTALPVSERGGDGNFFPYGHMTRIWSSSGHDQIGWFLGMNKDDGTAGVRGNVKVLGEFVRCLKD